MFGRRSSRELPADLKSFLSLVETNGEQSFYSLSEDDRDRAVRLVGIGRLKKFLIDGELFIGTKKQSEKSYYLKKSPDPSNSVNSEPV